MGQRRKRKQTGFTDFLIFAVLLAAAAVVLLAAALRGGAGSVGADREPEESGTMAASGGQGNGEEERSGSAENGEGELPVQTQLPDSVPSGDDTSAEEPSDTPASSEGGTSEEAEGELQGTPEQSPDPAESIPSAESTAPPENTEPDADSPEERAKAIVAAMTMEQKTAQIFFITPEELTGVSTATVTGSLTEAALQKYPVGGLVYFGKNLVSPEQTRDMLTKAQDYMCGLQGFPIFLGVDEEGGRVLRVGSRSSFGVEKIDAMGKLAQQQDPQIIFDAADTIGAYLSDLGFNVDFAPDADVLTNENNQVIGDRSFGTDPQTVADMAWSFAQGLHENNVLAAYKHFPGHGGTMEDSHTGYAFSYKTLEELQSVDLVPFQSGSDHGADFIMVAHISVPEVNGSDIPASLSQTLVTNVLREQMGYEGIIITDSLSMGAIANYYTPAQSAVLAVGAGCDMLLMPGNLQEAYTAVLEAVRDGTITEERLDESVYRIVLAKLRLKERSEQGKMVLFPSPPA